MKIFAILLLLCNFSYNKKLFCFIKNYFILFNKKLNFIDYVSTDL